MACGPRGRTGASGRAPSSECRRRHRRRKRFRRWQDHLMGFTRAELESYVDSTVPDLVGPGLPAAVRRHQSRIVDGCDRTHFAHPGNRFYPALLAAGIIERADRPWDGHDRRRPSSPARTRDRHHQHRPSRHGQGVGALDRGAARRRGTPQGVRSDCTPRSSWPWQASLRTGTAFGQPKAAMGEQPNPFEGARLFVVPNPSGLNAHETTATIAAAYREPAVAAGVVRRAMASSGRRPRRGIMGRWRMTTSTR